MKSLFIKYVVCNRSFDLAVILVLESCESFTFTMWLQETFVVPYELGIRNTFSQRLSNACIYNATRATRSAEVFSWSEHVVHVHVHGTCDRKAPPPRARRTVERLARCGSDDWLDVSYRFRTPPHERLIFVYLVHRLF